MYSVHINIIIESNQIQIRKFDYVYLDDTSFTVVNAYMHSRDVIHTLANLDPLFRQVSNNINDDIFTALNNRVSNTNLRKITNILHTQTGYNVAYSVTAIKKEA